MPGILLAKLTPDLAARMENIRINKINTSQTDAFKTQNRPEIKIKHVNNKIRNFSIYSTICSSLGYLVVTLSIIKIYIAFNGRHPVLLAVTLLNLCFAMGVLIFLALKVTVKDSRLFFADTTIYLNYQMQRLAGQRKLTALYMLEYTILLVISGMFFSGTGGMWLLLKILLSVSIITYISGTHFIVASLRLSRKLKGLQADRKQASHLERFRQN